MLNNRFIICNSKSDVNVWQNDIEKEHITIISVYNLLNSQT